MWLAWVSPTGSSSKFDLHFFSRASNVRTIHAEVLSPVGESSRVTELCAATLAMFRSLHFSATLGLHLPAND